ncbi:hypothetical protein HYT33_01590 [Candidatus Roizmanbacteria bacterium]|nr:hypothetical protein [Candidatus Roizmanbacteria bacterium]
MSFVQRVLWFSLVTAIVFYLALLLFGKNVVFGNALASTVQAVIVSSLLVGLVVSLVGEWGKKKKYSTNVWMLIYWFANSLTIYVLARTPISKVVGIGLKPAIWLALAVGFVVNMAQYGVWKAMSRK